MLIGNREESDRVARIVERGARQANKDELQFLLDIGAKWKPSGYDAHVNGVRLRYEGKQDSFVRDAMKVRFPSSHVRMPCSPINLLKTIARQDTAAYPVPAQRWLAVDGERMPRTVESEDGEETDSGDEERVARFTTLIERARLDVVCPEVERRAVVAKASLVHVRWDAVGERAIVTPYWPSDVVIIPSTEAPDDLARSQALIAKCAGPGGISGPAWYNLWTRPANGRWRSELMSADGDAYVSADAPESEYPGELPWAMLRFGLPSGGPWVDEDRDLVHVIDNFNASRSNEQYTSDLQGHTPIWTNGLQFDSKTLAIGPDVIMDLGRDGTAGTLSLSPALTDMREGRKLSMRELAISRGNSPDAFSVEPGAPLSGVSRQIANLPHEQVRLEAVEYVRAFERDLLRILVEVHDMHSGQPEIGGAGITYHMAPTDRPEIMDPEQRQRMLIEARDAGLISTDRLAVEAGYYRTEDEARQALEKVSAMPEQAARADGGSRFGDRLEAEMGRDAPVEKGDPEPAPAAEAVATASDPAAVADVAKTALNGAQVTSLVAVIVQITKGEIPRATGVSIISAAFQMDAGEADRLVGEAGKGFKPTQPEPAQGAPPRSTPDGG